MRSHHVHFFVMGMNQDFPIKIYLMAPRTFACGRWSGAGTDKIRCLKTMATEKQTYRFSAYLNFSNFSGNALVTVNLFDVTVGLISITFVSASITTS